MVYTQNHNFSRHKDKRLYFRFMKIFKLVCLSNPSVKNNPMYIDGIGIIECEWIWVYNKIIELSYAIPYESEFYVLASQIIKFLRKKQK